MMTTQTGTVSYRYRPVLFFVLTYLFTWIFWIPAAFVPEQAAAPLMVLGLLAPAAVSTLFVLLSGTEKLKRGRLHPAFAGVRAEPGPVLLHRGLLLYRRGRRRRAGHDPAGFGHRGGRLERLL